MKNSLIKKIIFVFGCLLMLSLSFYHTLVRAQMRTRPITQTKVEYTSFDQRDPFKSPFERTGEEEETELPISVGLSHLKVQGMVWGSKAPQAIINDTVVKTGDVIEGAEILDIRKEGIYVLYEGRQYILRPAIIIPKP